MSNRVLERLLQAARKSCEHPGAHRFGDRTYWVDAIPSSLAVSANVRCLSPGGFEVVVSAMLGTVDDGSIAGVTVEPGKHPESLDKDVFADMVLSAFESYFEGLQRNPRPQLLLPRLRVLGEAQRVGLEVTQPFSVGGPPGSLSSGLNSLIT